MGLARRGVTCRPLAVSAAFHGPLVAASRQAFRETLEELEFKPGLVPVFANATAAPYPANPDLARDLLADQLCRPVEFLAQVEAMYQSGARTFLEVGPDARLTGLVRSILGGRDHHAIAVDASRGERGEGNMADLAIALANLAALGYPVRLHRWDEGFRAPIRNSSKKTLTVKVCGANPSPGRLTEPGAVADEPLDPVRLSSLSPVGRVQPLSPAQADRNSDSLDRTHERLEPTPPEWTMNPADLNHHPATNGQAATSPAAPHHHPAGSESTRVAAATAGSTISGSRAGHRANSGQPAGASAPCRTDRSASPPVPRGPGRHPAQLPRASGAASPSDAGRPGPARTEPPASFAARDLAD